MILIFICLNNLLNLKLENEISVHTLRLRIQFQLELDSIQVGQVNFGLRESI